MIKIILYILLVIFIILYICVSKTNSINRCRGYNGGYQGYQHSRHYNPPIKEQTLAQRLTNEGWVLYTKSNCIWCSRQIDMFGTDACHLKKVDCLDCELKGEHMKGCQMTWVYPSWVKIDGEKIIIKPGTHTLDQLKKLLKTHHKNSKGIKKYHKKP